MTKKKNKKSDKTQETSTVDKAKQRRLFFGLALIILTIYLMVTFLSYFFTWETDQSVWDDITNRGETAENLTSKIGAYLGHLFV